MKTSETDSRSDPGEWDDIMKRIQPRECEVKEQQRIYVASHIGCGHSGHCFAWLDTAFCAQAYLSGHCSFIHDQPKSWTDSQRARHVVKLAFVKDLWEGADPAEFVHLTGIKPDKVVLQNISHEVDHKRCHSSLFPFLDQNDEKIISPMKRRRVRQRKSNICAILSPRIIITTAVSTQVVSEDELEDPKTQHP